MSQKTWNYLNLFIPLFIGCLVYLIFKQDKVLAEAENTIPLFGLIRSHVFIEFHPRSYIGIFFLNHFCDFLWAYSLTWACINSSYSIKSGIVQAIAFILLNEFIQLTPYICATFDWLDIVYETAAIIISTLIFIFSNQKYSPKT